jgi:hypothetical protein
MPKTIEAPEDSVEIIAEIQPANSRKREITASIVAGVVTVSLGLVASGAIERVASLVKNRIAPKPEKNENE